MRRLLPAILLALSVAAPTPARANAPRNAVKQAPVVFDGRVLVRIAPIEAASLRAESSRGLARMRAASAVLNGLATSYDVRTAAPALADRLLFREARDAGLDRWFVFDVDPAPGFAAIAARLRAMPGVEFVEADRAMLHDEAAPNDSLFSKNWGHGNTGTFPSFEFTGGHVGPNVGTVGFDSNVQTGWGAPTGYGPPSLIIAIIDTGVDPTHPDLRQVQGWDFVHGDSIADDVDGHGTACAGIAAGIANNTHGVAGVAGGCAIMPLKDVEGNTFNISWLVGALAYAATHGAKVASMSFTVTPRSQAIADALTAADAAGVLLFAATGNENNSVMGFPANHPSVIAVGAASPCGSRKRSSNDSTELNPGVLVDSLGVSCDNEVWWGSNWGTAVKDDSAAVDIIGPTMLPTTDIQGAAGFTDNGYDDFFNGTSCATPYVAGVAALLRAQHPTWTNTQVRARLMQTAIDISDVQTPVGWDKYTGYGMVNAGLPDLQPYAFAGWSSPIVPRPTADATFGSVPAPTTLNGDVSSYVSRAVINLGDAHSGTDQGAMLLDGVQVGTLNYSLPPGIGAFSLSNVTTVRGGRHTLGVVTDNNDTVLESNESNNGVAHQWSWTPTTMPTSASAVVARATPPDRNAGRGDVPVSETTYDNCDAVRMAGPPLLSSTEFWVMGLHAADDASDLDLELHFPTSSATANFTPANLYIASQYGAGKTDFAIVNLGKDPEDNLDASSILVAGTGASRFESRLSGTPTTFSGTTTTISGSFASDMMVDVKDLTVLAGGVGPLSLELNATAGLHFAVYDTNFSFANRLIANRVSVHAGLSEGTTWTVGQGRYAIVVYRDRGTDGTAALTYSITVRRPTAELVASSAGGQLILPAGVYKDGVGNVSSPPTVLDGNANTTRFYYGYSNTGPAPASGFQARELMDGAEVLTWTPGPIASAGWAYWISTLRTVRGGRHTMGFQNDITNVIDEFDETNNDYAIQQVWSPLPLTMDVPVTRPAPPDPQGGWAQIPAVVQRYNNVDGLRTPVLQNTGNDGYWNFFALAPVTATDDVDLAVYQPISTGPSDGFTTPAATSALPAGRVDYVGVNATNARAVDLGIVKSGAATGSVVVHGTRSIHLASESGTYGPYTLDPNKLVACFDYPATGVSRQIRVLNMSGNANLDLHVWDPLADPNVLRTSADAQTAEANGDGLDEVLQHVGFGWPVIAVTKRATGDIAKTATFYIQIGGSTVDVGDGTGGPSIVRLAPVRPNPVRDAAAIVFDLPRACAVKLAAYDIAGRRVATLASGAMSAGSHAVSWTPGAQLASGVYLLRLEADGVESVRRMVVTR